MSFEIDTSKWSEQAKHLVLATGKDAGEVLRSEGKLFLNDCARLTPPTNKRPLGESFNAQRRTGEAAVAADIGSLFTDCQKLSIVQKNPRIARDLREYAALGQIAKATTLLRFVGVKSTIVLEATRELHRASRGYGGRVLRSRRGKYVVLRGASIRALIEAKKKAVGKEKAGWLTAAKGLGVPFPEWIAKHGLAPGLFKDEPGENPSITIGNLVGYAQAHGPRLQIMKRAIDRRVESMTNRLEHILKKNFREH